MRDLPMLAAILATNSVAGSFEPRQGAICNAGDWLGGKVNDLDNPGTAVVSTRTVDGAAFQPSATKYTLVGYTINQVATNDQDGTVELRCDAANPPTVVRASARLAPSDPGAATPSVTARQQLVFLVPPAHYVKLVAAGTGTPTVSEQFEIPIS